MGLTADPITLRALQDMIRQRDHHPELRNAYFLKLVEEMGELAQVFRKNARLDQDTGIRGTIEEELYDVLYYLAALANVCDIDLEECVRLKEDYNEKRYNRA